MKTKEMQKFAKAWLLPTLPGFELAGKVLFQKPVADVLRGFCFEDSDFSTNTGYVWVFVQPLYVPKGYLALSFGKRLFHKTGFFSRRQDWDLSSLESSGPDLRAAIESQGLPHLSKLSTPTEIVENLFRVTGLRGDPYAIEAVAYSQIRLGDVVKGARRLEGLLRQVRGEEKYEEVTIRGRLLLEATKQGNLTASNLLNQWRIEMARTLKIPTSEN